MNSSGVVYLSYKPKVKDNGIGSSWQNENYPSATNYSLINDQNTPTDLNITLVNENQQLKDILLDEDPKADGNNSGIGTKNPVNADLNNLTHGNPHYSINANNYPNIAINKSSNEKEEENNPQGYDMIKYSALSALISDRINDKDKTFPSPLLKENHENSKRFINSNVSDRNEKPEIIRKKREADGTEYETRSFESRIKRVSKYSKDRSLIDHRKDKNSYTDGETKTTSSDRNITREEQRDSERSFDKENRDNSAKDINTARKENYKKVAKNEKRIDEPEKYEQLSKESKKNDDADSPLFNFLYIFEIFGWLTSQDVIVRWIIAAIAGIIGFGIIFSSMGLQNYMQ